MAESLFHRLDATGGTYELNMQYRMNRSVLFVYTYHTISFRRAVFRINNVYWELI